MAPLLGEKGKSKKVVFVEKKRRKERESKISEQSQNGSYYLSLCPHKQGNKSINIAKRKQQTNLLLHKLIFWASRGLRIEY